MDPTDDSHDYYSYAPRVRLDHPVALVGFPGCQPLQTVRVATMLTGLGSVLLPHQVTHRMGRHIEGLLAEGRQQEVHEAELDLLRRAGAQRSPPVIALGPTTLDDAACRDWVRQNCRLVHLRQSLREAVHAIESQRADDPRKHAHLLSIGIDEASLASLFGLRSGLYEQLAQHEVWIRGRPPLDVGRELPTLLGW